MHISQTAAIVVALLTAIGCLTSQDPGVLLLVGAALVTGLLLLWPKGGVPVLLIPFLLQWISVATKPIAAAVNGVPVNGLSEFGGDLNGAATFAAIALIALAIGMRVGVLRGNDTTSSSLQADVANWSPGAVLRVGLGLVFAGHVSALSSRYVAGLTELLLALSNITFCGLFLLIYWSLRTRRLVAVAWLVALMEIAFGMTGFFGVFRTALFTVALATMCAQHRFRPQSALLGATIGAFALVLMVFWSSVKTDFRVLLNNGTLTQSEQQPMAVRLAFLSDRAAHFGGDEFDQGFKALIDRTSYIDFLSGVLEYVPNNLPHEDGRRTLAAVIHIFTPRIIFTSKPPLESDTVVTARYTGLSFTDLDYTSISIGYLGEAYIDFGRLGAVIFCFVFGALIGRVTSIIMAYPSVPIILNVGLALVATIPMAYFETALIKTIGGTIASIITVFLLQRLFLPWMMARYLSPRSRSGIAVRQPAA